MTNNVDFALQLDAPCGMMLRGKSSVGAAHSETTTHFLTGRHQLPLKTARPRLTPFAHLNYPPSSESDTARVAVRHQG
jgi:hypothetical protein